VTSHGKEVRRISLRRERDTVKISHIGLAFVVDSPIVKFSLDHTFLALLKSYQQVEFINLETQILLTQRCKRTTSKIFDFFWTGPDTFFFVTNNGFELYQFSSSKNPQKLLKEQKMTVKWFSYSSKLLVLAGGPTQSTIHAFFFKGTSIIKIPKFDLDTSGSSNNRILIKENQVTICRLYDKVCCIHHQVAKKQLHLYQMNRESVSLSASINLSDEGNVIVHVVDNLLVCHNLKKQITSIFDIREEESVVAAPLSPGETKIESKEIYGEEWIYCPANYIIIPSKGLLCEVKVNLEGIICAFTKKRILIDFLLRRTNSKQIILQQLQTLVREKSSLAVVSRIFKQVNAILQEYPEREDFEGVPAPTYNFQFMSSALLSPQKQEERDSVRNMKRDGAVVITQSDMHKTVFLPMDTEEMDQKYFVAMLVEYIRSLSHYKIEVLYFLYEMIINSLVRNNHFYQLHQFLQYHVIADSAPVAYQLLSIEQRYPPAGQLALDMLKRLNTQPSHIIEILLLRKQILTALRVLRKTKKEISKNEITRFLEASVSADDEILFYTVYKYFDERNLISQDHATFTAAYQKKFTSCDDL